jgi:hypothetical protein
MSGNEAHLPELVPVLSRASQPAAGACFMELACIWRGAVE